MAFSRKAKIGSQTGHLAARIYTYACELGCRVQRTKCTRFGFYGGTLNSKSEDGDEDDGGIVVVLRTYFES